VITWRLPLAIAALVAAAGTTAYFTFPRAPHPQGKTIRIPDRRPADAAAGAPGWHWPDGVPGWRPGQAIDGLNVSGVQPIEVETAQLAAAHEGLDADSVRVLVSLRVDRSGPLAILAARKADGWTLFDDPACLGTLLTGDAPVAWECPGAYPDSPTDLAARHVLVAARRSHGALALVGVARGDVTRVVLVNPGMTPPRNTLYDRGKTWGEFQASVDLRPDAVAQLLVYGEARLLETVPLRLAPGAQSTFR
jgi:hypothetical protein